MEQRKIEVTKKDLEQMGNRVKALLGKSVDDKAKESNKTPLEIIKEEIKLLHVYNDTTAVDDYEMFDYFDDREELYDEPSVARTLELLEYITENKLWESDKDDVGEILILFKDHGIDYELCSQTKEILKKEFWPLMVPEYIEKVKSADKDLIKEGYSWLVGLELNSEDVVIRSALKEHIPALIKVMQKHYIDAPYKTVWSKYLRVIYYFQDFFPEEFAKLDNIYADLLEDDRINESNQDSLLYLLRTMHSSVRELLSKETVEKILNFCQKKAEVFQEESDDVWYEQNLLPAFRSIAEDSRIDVGQYKTFLTVK